MAAIDDTIRQMRALHTELNNVSSDIKAHNTIDYNVKLTGVEAVRDDINRINESLEDIPKRMSSTVGEMSTQLITALREINNAGRIDNVAKDIDRMAAALNNINSTDLTINVDNAQDIQQQFKELSAAFGNIKKEVDGINSSGALDGLSSSMQGLMETVPKINSDMNQFTEAMNRAAEAQQRFTLASGQLETHFKGITDASSNLQSVLQNLFSMSNTADSSQALENMNQNLEKTKTNVSALQNAMKSAKFDSAEGAAGTKEQIQRVQDSVNKLNNDVNSTVSKLVGTSLGDISKLYGNISTMGDNAAKVAEALNKSVADMKNISETERMALQREIDQLKTDTTGLSDDINNTLNKAFSARINAINTAIDNGTSSVLNQMSNGQGLASQYSRGVKATGSNARHVWQQAAAAEQLAPAHSILGFSWGQQDLSEIKNDASALSQMQYEYQQGSSEVEGLFTKAEQANAKGDYQARDKALNQAKARFASLIALQDNMNQKARSLGENWKLMSESDKARLGKEGQEIEKSINNVVKSTRKNNVHLIGLKEAHNIDVDPKKLKNIKQSTQELGKLSEAMDKTGKKSESTFQKILHKSQSVVDFLEKKINLLKSFAVGFGVGAFLMGPLDTLRKAYGYHQTRGRDIYQTLGTDAYVGVEDLGSAAGRARGRQEAGDSLFVASGGMIDRKVVNDSYNKFMRNIGGHYGGSAEQASRDMDRLARSTSIMKSVYGIDDSVMSEAIQTYYKEMNMSVDETEQSLAKLAQTAQASNVPMGQYLKMVTGIAKKFMAIGIDGKKAESVMSNLMVTGMRAEVAQEITLQLGGAMSKFADNKGEVGFAAALNGQNPWEAIANAAYTHDEKGNVRQGWAQEIAKGMDTMFNARMAVYGNDPNFRRMGATDLFKQMGFNQRSSSTLASAYLKYGGNSKQFQELLQEKADEKDNPNATLEKINEQILGQLQSMSGQLAESDRLNAQADSNLWHSSERIGSAIDSILETVSPLFEKFQTAMIDLMGDVVGFVQELVTSETFSNIMGYLTKALDYLPEIFAVITGLTVANMASNIGIPGIAIGAAAVGGLAYFGLSDETKSKIWNTITEYGKPILDKASNFFSELINDGDIKGTATKLLDTIGDTAGKAWEGVKNWWKERDIAGLLSGDWNPKKEKLTKQETAEEVIKKRDLILNDNQNIDNEIAELRDELKKIQDNDNAELKSSISEVGNRAQEIKDRIAALEKVSNNNTEKLQTQAKELNISTEEFISTSSQDIIEKVDANSETTAKFIEKKHYQSSGLYRLLSKLLGENIAGNVTDVANKLLNTDILGFGTINEILYRIKQFISEYIKAKAKDSWLSYFMVEEDDNEVTKWLKTHFLDTRAKDVKLLNWIGWYDDFEAASRLESIKAFKSGSLDDIDVGNLLTGYVKSEVKGMSENTQEMALTAINMMNGDDVTTAYAKAVPFTGWQWNSNVDNAFDPLSENNTNNKSDFQKGYDNDVVAADEQTIEYWKGRYYKLGEDKRTLDQKIKDEKDTEKLAKLKAEREKVQDLYDTYTRATYMGSLDAAAKEVAAEKAKKNSGNSSNSKVMNDLGNAFGTLKDLAAGVGSGIINAISGTAEAADSDKKPETKDEAHQSRENTTSSATRQITTQQKKEQELSKERNIKLHDLGTLHEKLMNMFQSSVKDEHNNLLKMIAVSQDILADIKMTTARAGATIAIAAEDAAKNSGGGSFGYQGNVNWDALKNAGTDQLSAQDIKNAQARISEYEIFFKRLEKDLPYFEKASKKYNVPMEWLMAIASSEGGGHQSSDNGMAAGHMGILYKYNGQYLYDAETIKKLKEDPETNIDMGAKIWNQKMEYAKGDVVKALSLYSGESGKIGPTTQLAALREYGLMLKYRELLRKKYNRSGNSQQSEANPPSNGQSNTVQQIVGYKTPEDRNKYGLDNQYTSVQLANRGWQNRWDALSTETKEKLNQFAKEYNALSGDVLKIKGNDQDTIYLNRSLEEKQMDALQTVAKKYGLSLNKKDDHIELSLKAAVQNEQDRLLQKVREINVGPYYDHNGGALYRKMNLGDDIIQHHKITKPKEAEELVKSRPKSTDADKESGEKALEEKAKTYKRDGHDLTANELVQFYGIDPAKNATAEEIQKLADNLDKGIDKNGKSLENTIKSVMETQHLSYDNAIRELVKRGYFTDTGMLWNTMGELDSKYNIQARDNAQKNRLEISQYASTKMAYRYLNDFSMYYGNRSFNNGPTNAQLLDMSTFKGIGNDNKSYWATGLNFSKMRENVLAGRRLYLQQHGGQFNDDGTLKAPVLRDPTGLLSNHSMSEEITGMASAGKKKDFTAPAAKKSASLVLDLLNKTESLSEDAKHTIRVALASDDEEVQKIMEEVLATFKSRLEAAGVNLELVQEQLKGEIQSAIQNIQGRENYRKIAME